MKWPAPGCGLLARCGPTLLGDAASRPFTARAAAGAPLRPRPQALSPSGQDGRSSAGGVASRGRRGTTRSGERARARRPRPLTRHPRHRLTRAVTSAREHTSLPHARATTSSQARMLASAWTPEHRRDGILADARDGCYRYAPEELRTLVTGSGRGDVLPSHPKPN